MENGSPLMYDDTCDRESKLTLLAIFHFSRIWASWNINAAWGRKKNPPSILLVRFPLGPYPVPAGPPADP